MKSQWNKRVLHIFQWPTITLGAVATTLGGVDAATNGEIEGEFKSRANLDPLVLPNTLNSTANDRYAAHRSHSSHASHRSSGGGGVAVPRSVPKAAPAPKYTPPPIYTPAPTQPAPQPTVRPAIPKPSTGDISGMVVRVQAALMRLGYFNGDIDGLLGPETRASITKYQKDKSLKTTGRMDIDTLTALGISIP